MRGLFSIAYADLASRRFSTALTVIAIMLGTAVVAATFTTNVAVEDSMRAAALASVGNADFVVDATDDQGFASQAVAAVKTMPGVTLVAPQVQKRAFYRTAKQRGFAEIVGVDPLIDPLVHPYRLAAGRLLEPSDQQVAVLGRDWAAAAGLSVGDKLEIITSEGFQSFSVVGLVEESDLSQRGSGGIVRVPLAVAQPALGFGDRVLGLSLQVEPDRLDEVKAGLERVLPYVFVVRDSSQVLTDLLASIRDLQAALAFFGFIALLAGAMLVFNTLSLTVTQRTQELGLLRAIGASTGFVVRLTLAEGLLLGVVGAALGAIAGQLLAVALVLVIGRQQGIAVQGIPFSAAGVAVSVALGIAVTLFASVIPALRAGRTTPLMAMSAGATIAEEERGSGRAWLALPVAIVVVAVGLAPVAGDAWRVAKVVSLLLSVPLFVYLSQFAIPLLAAIAALPVRRLSRGVGTMAERTVRRQRGQTAVTVGSFLISLALIVALVDGAASFTSAGQQWAAQLFPGDEVIVSPVDQPIALVDDFGVIAGVDQVSAVSVLPVVWQGVRLTAAAVDPAHYFQAFQFAQGDRTAAFQALRRGEGVLIPAALATEMELKIGDPMPLQAGDRTGDFTVAGVIAHSFPSADSFGAVIVPRDTAQALFGVTTFRFLAITAAPDANTAQLDRELASTAQSFGMSMGTQADLARSIGDAVGGLLGLLAGLVAIGVIVGSLGLVNTMMMNLAQRAREIGILRAVGMGRAQVRGLAIAEAAIMGFLGGVLGVALGAYITAALVQLSRTADLDPRFVFSLPLAAAVIVAGVVVAMIASLYPAARAGRTDIVEIIRQG